MARQQRQEMGFAALVPPPQVWDSEHVRINLDAAQVLAENGDLREAMRWLRRAADAAEQDGNHQRALVIARAAAGLAHEHRPTTAPPSSQPSALSLALIGMVRQLKGLPEIPSSEPERSRNAANDKH